MPGTRFGRPPARDAVRALGPQLTGVHCRVLPASRSPGRAGAGRQRIRWRIRLSRSRHASGCDGMRQGGGDCPRQGVRTAGAGNRLADAASGARGIPARNYESGEGGIRTLGRVAPTPVFETGPIGRSGTSPKYCYIKTYGVSSTSLSFRFTTPYTTDRESCPRRVMTAEGDATCSRTMEVAPCLPILLENPAL